MQYLIKIKEEIKRTDHLLYVSLKYTRTVDVMRNAIERLINAYTLISDALLEYAKRKKKITDIPPSPIMRSALVKKAYSDDEKITEGV